MRGDFSLSEIEMFLYLSPFKRAISSVGSEHLVYTEGVGGSSPSLPTSKPLIFERLFLFLLFKTLQFYISVI